MLDSWGIASEGVAFELPSSCASGASSNRLSEPVGVNQSQLAVSSCDTLNKLASFVVVESPVLGVFGLNKLLLSEAIRFCLSLPEEGGGGKKGFC